MAKDPAFLFYPNDFIGGTMGMNLEEKGAYLELLILQFNKGAFTIDQAKRILGNSFEAIWPHVFEKFKETDGMFLNERLELEREKRKATAKKNKDRIDEYWAKKRIEEAGKNTTGNTNVYTMSGKTLELPIENENENENIDIVINKENKTDFKNFPNEGDLSVELPAIKIGAVKELIKITKGVLLTDEKINSFWYVFKTQNFTGKKFYQNFSDVTSHFINWMKMQNLKDGKNPYHNNDDLMKQMAKVGL